MHNVLKQIRALSTGSADRLMKALEIGMPDLLWRISSDREVGVRAIPVLRNRIGPGTDALVLGLRGYVPLPESLLKDLVDPVAGRLGPDLALPKALAIHDLVLLDRNPRVRAAPGGSCVWVVADGSGLRARYLRTDGALLYIGAESALEDPRNWYSISLQGRNILDIVRARIVWMGREMEKEPA
jgi:hypothetical protein